MLENCYTKDIYSLPRKLMYSIFSLCDDTDFPQIIIWHSYRVTFWTKHDPVMIEKLY